MRGVGPPVWSAAVLDLLVVLDALADRGAGAGTDGGARDRADRAADHRACGHAAEAAGRRPLLGVAAAGGEQEERAQSRARPGEVFASGASLSLIGVGISMATKTTPAARSSSR